MLRPVAEFLSLFFLFFPDGIQVYRGTKAEHKISKLERNGDFIKARDYRSHILTEIPVDFAGPLWRSEGDDKFKRLNDYRGALDAYIQAEKSIESKKFIASANYGVTDPGHIFYHASVSAINLDDMIKAKEYFKKFLSVCYVQADIEKYKEQINWLKKTIKNDSKDDDSSNN